MKNKYFKDISEKLNKEYNLDVVNDVLLSCPNKVILYTDSSKSKDLELFVISGNLRQLGFEDKESIKLSEFFDVFDFDNKYAFINGKNEYFQEIYHQFNNYSKALEVSFPIRFKENRRWLRFDIFPSPKLAHILVVTIKDVTELHNQEEETFRKTHIDSLTTLYNKYTFDYHYGKVYLDPGFHVMYIDIDDFKKINDQYGHIIGNQLLIEFGHLLKILETEKMRFYRLGGDEFVGLLVASTEEVKELIDIIFNQIKKIKLPESDDHLKISMGVMKATESNDLAKKADKLMYKVKSSGKNGYLYEVESD
ncbi:MAG: GGDEF domain-containing protein [Candidatus Izemoplasmatales bacterium]